MMILKIKYIPAVAVIVLVFMACNGGQLDDVRGDSTQTSTTLTDTNHLQNQDEMATVSSDTLQRDSRQFINEIENKLSLNIHLSKAAMNQSADETIKNLGKTVADQLTELHNKLKDIAQTKNIQLATSMTTSMQEALNTVTSKKDTQFDKTYLERVIEDTKATINWLETEGPKLSDEQLRQFATTSVPIFKQHHDAAKAVKEKK